MGIIGGFFLKLVQPLVNFFFASMIQIFWSGVEFGLNLLDDVTSLFEKIAFDNWSNVIFGADMNDGKFHLFPKTSSPLFYIWISMLTFGVLLLGIYIAVYGIKKIKGDEGLIEGNYVANRNGGVFTKAIVIGLTFFFVPFMFITGMGMSSKVTKILFPTRIKANPQAVSSFKTSFNQILTQSLKNIYEFPNKYTIKFNNNPSNAIDTLYSHSQKSGYKDGDYDRWIMKSKTNGGSIQPFQKLNDVLKRIEYEMVAFNKASINRAPQEITDISQSIPTLIDSWKNKWGIGGNQGLKVILSQLGSLTSQIKTNAMDEGKANKVEILRKKLKSYSKDTTSLLVGFAKFLSKKDNIAFIFNNSAIINLNTFNNINDPLILSKQTNPKALVDTEAMISYYNIRKISTQYIFSTLVGNSFRNWNAKINDHLPTSKQENLEGYSKGLAIINNGLKLGDGNTVSLFDLQALYGGKEPLSLTTLIYQIASGNKGHDYSNAPSFDMGKINQTTPRIFIGLMMLFTAMGLVGNLVARVVLRVGKLGWLWIQAYVVLPTSLTDGGAKVRVWISMVFVELLAIFALMGMWYIWKYMSGPIKDLIYSHGGSEIAKGVVTFFALTSLLGIITSAVEWLAEIIGASDSIQDVSSQMKGARQVKGLGARSLSRGGKIGRGGIKHFGSKQRFLKSASSIKQGGLKAGTKVGSMGRAAKTGVKSIGKFSRHPAQNTWSGVKSVGKGFRGIGRAVKSGWGK